MHGLDAEAEIALAKLSTYSVKTTAIHKILDRKTREIVVAFAARAIPPTTRLWLCGQSLVGSDGSLWRSRSAARAIDGAFEEETQYSPQEIPCSKVIAERVFEDLGLGEKESDTVWAQLQAQADRGRAGLSDVVKTLLEA